MHAKRSLLWTALAGGIAAGVAVTVGVVRARARRLAAGGPATVPHVDVARYMGRWHEIARYPNRFQRDDCRATTATYGVLNPTTVRVVNACVHADGRTERITGTARVVDPASNAKLKVTFFWPIAGDYWIIDLAPDYRYAVVSEPTRRYLWILARAPELDPADYDGILERLRAQGFDTGRLLQRP